MARDLSFKGPFSLFTLGGIVCGVVAGALADGLIGALMLSFPGVCFGAMAGAIYSEPKAALRGAALLGMIPVLIMLAVAAAIGRLQELSPVEASMVFGMIFATMTWCGAAMAALLAMHFRGARPPDG